jgi:hypothetical protein
MGNEKFTTLGDVIGRIPYRVALAGGWIDQPFVSRLNPRPPGSMVVVALEPDHPFLERAGMATGTRNVALKLWGNRLPDRPRERLVRELYDAENHGKPEPSGSQDMIGLVYPGVSRLDYDFAHEGGIFPRQIESTSDPAVVDWLETVLHLVAINQRPPGYNPLGEQHLDPNCVARLGGAGRECFDAIVARDLRRLGVSFNECMNCWQAILPATVRHPTISIDLPGILAAYQAQYPGAMYSGCGGGYLIVASDRPVPGAFQLRVRR